MLYCCNDKILRPIARLANLSPRTSRRLHFPALMSLSETGQGDRIMRNGFGGDALCAILGIIVAIICFYLVCFDKRFRFVWGGPLLLLCASVVSFGIWDASYWGRWGEECLGLDVIISCDNYHFLYTLGWWLYCIAILLFIAVGWVRIVVAIVSAFAGWRR